ncbi:MULTISPECIES: universal stress protein [Halostella]|uniref:universal stress protein n=1 Tax=Halostella TaxID=1843185 RepID=UPI001081776C|nr:MULTISPECIES: universal stress protein [Halostella]
MAIETVLLAVGEKDEPRAERLADAAIDVAAPTGATVVLAHVFTDDEYDTVLDQLDFDPSGEVTPDEVANRHATIRTIGDLLSSAGVEFETRGAVGSHGETIVDLAKDVSADRVVVGGRRRSPTGKAVFGSVAQEVMLSSPCPVTFVRDA